MAITADDQEKFDDLCEAAKSGHLALLECKDRATGEYRAVICIVDNAPTAYEVEPLGHLVTGNPFEQYTPPGNPREVVIPGNKQQN